MAGKPAIKIEINPNYFLLALYLLSGVPSFFNGPVVVVVFVLFSLYLLSAVPSAFKWVLVEVLFSILVFEAVEVAGLLATAVVFAFL